MACRLAAEDTPRRRAEAAQILEGVEADQVGPEDSGERLRARRQRPEDARVGEGHVQEEADPQVAACGADHGGHQHQLEVLDEDDVSGLRVLHDGIREALVDLAVGGPVGAIELDPLDEAVQQRPDAPVAGPQVVLLVLLFAQVNGLEALLAQQRPCLRGEALRVAHHPRPADPKPA